MTSRGIDEILNRLSVKFNRIICDRDFVECVSEDLQTIIDDKNTCRVLVFPTLSPNYLRVVKYQAKLCDLAVISLGSGNTKSVGICHKKYFISSTEPSTLEEDCKKRISTNIQMAENSVNVITKKRRPPLQLYIPPAQRVKRRGKETSTNNLRSKINSTTDNSVVQKFETLRNPIKEEQSIKIANRDNTTRINDQKGISFYCIDDVDCLNESRVAFPDFNYYQCNCAKLLLFKDNFPNAKILIFCMKKAKHSFNWIDNFKEDSSILSYNTSLSALLAKDDLFFKAISKFSEVNLFEQNGLDFRDCKCLFQEISSFKSNCCFYGDEILYLPTHNMYSCFLVPDFQRINYSASLYTKGDINGFHLDKYSKIDSCILFSLMFKSENVDISSLLDNSMQQPAESKICHSDQKVDEILAQSQAVNEPSAVEPKSVLKEVDRVIVLDERIEVPPKIESNKLPSPNTKQNAKNNEHEQEKEIMRRTKQNINRKTRSIIKYVDDDNETLKIGKGENVNNWEDLFNEEGELQDDLFTEVIQKVGNEVTIVKATEDYSAYASKHIEELEHIVELYDFPSTLETHDIISAFSSLNSDSMYVKWLDDTRALLVLGSYTQAQKALRLSSPLIKARPMSVASSLALEKANQFDLKPAMKRPQTNLQTARRLITSHLGAKTNVSREQNAREREDLRIAKEMKKQAKQNEKDAWEGNLRSAIR